MECPGGVLTVKTSLRYQLWVLRLDVTPPSPTAEGRWWWVVSCPTVRAHGSLEVEVLSMVLELWVKGREF